MLLGLIQFDFVLACGLPFVNDGHLEGASRGWQAVAMGAAAVASCCSHFVQALRLELGLAVSPVERELRASGCYYSSRCS